mmetsp:Transcript_13290/g.21755  ORF Transcript_13290/g.21755 Transcript_13290/m.21755 type:complete len:521 (+) Transcript_13290:75-1637(+)
MALAGVWRLKKRGSDYVPGVEDIPGVPFITQMVDTVQTLLIEHTTDPHEEVHMSHTIGGKTHHTYYQLGKLNFEHVEKNSVIIAAFVFMGKDFNECSILRMGPESGQRSLQQLKLSDLGDEMRVEIDHVLPGGQSLKLIKRLERVPASVESSPISFMACDAINNWTRPNTHAPSMLRKVTLSIVDTIEVQTSKTQPPVRSGASALPVGSPERDSYVPKVMRRFNGELSNKERVNLFVIKVRLKKEQWEVYYRYREFDALRQFVESELKDLEQFQSIPPFPHKTLGRIGDKGLAQRKDALQNYVSFLCNVGAYNVSNVADVLSSFLEVPEHCVDDAPPVAMKAPQKLLRQSIVGIFPVGDSHPEMLPRHILGNILGPGLTVVKHGRRGSPAERIIYADPEHLQVLHWCEPGEERSLPTNEVLRTDGKDNKRSVSLVNVLEIRRGVELDPLKPGYCGTAVLRKHCEPAQYAFCFSLITAERTIDFQVPTKADFQGLVPNLIKYHKSLITHSKDDGAYTFSGR